MGNPMNIRSHKDKFTDLYASEILLLLRKSYFLIIQAVKTTQNTFTQWILDKNKSTWNSRNVSPWLAKD